MPGDHPGRPRLHVRPERGWLNDPNGACRVDGVWHLFFQYRPDAVTHGDIHWGHVSSTDLLAWREHPIALVPRPGGPDAAGCWSGCVVDDDGTPTAVYTAMPGRPEDASVVLARSDRSLLSWVPDAEPVAATPVLPGVTQVRDPFVFWHDGRRYAVQGAGSPGGAPSLVLHECTDLRRWRELGVLLDGTDPVAARVAPAEIWECPNLVRVGDRWLLVLSLWRTSPAGDVLVGSRWLAGDLLARDGGLRFVSADGGSFDTGPGCYAAHLQDVGDRVLAWAWARETARRPEEIAASGWAGALTFPRELELHGNRLVQVPARELTRLRAERLPDPATPVGAAFEVVARGHAELLRDGETVAEVVGTPDEPGRILVDGDLVEAFAAGTAETTWARPGPDGGWRVRAAPDTVEGYRLRVPEALESGTC